MCRRFTLTMVMVLAAPGLAHAGVLAQVVDGINDQSDNDGSAQGNGSSGGSGESEPKQSASSDSGCCYSDPTATLGMGYDPPPPYMPGTSELYAGVQSVQDSDGAMTLELRASYDDFGVSVRGTTFYERTGHDQYVHLDMWGIGGSYRLSHEDKQAVWLDFGLAGLNNNDDLSMNGVSLGGRFHRALSGELAVSGLLRRFWLEDGVYATESQIALHVSILQVSYRVMDFNVGPPLHGPEVGVVLKF